MTEDKYAALSIQQQYRIGLQLLNLVKLSETATVIDIGCGTGELSVALAERAPKGSVLAVDPDPSRLEYARYSNSVHNLIWYLKKLEDIEDSEAFDLAFSNFVFHWTTDKKKALAIVHRCLKPGGHLLMTVVTQVPPINEILFQMAGRSGFEFKSTVPLLTGSWWLDSLAETGFTVLKSSPTDGFNFFDIDEYLGWWESSSQGRFKIEMLSQENLLELRSLYPHGVRVYDGDGSLLVLAKKS